MDTESEPRTPPYRIEVDDLTIRCYDPTDAATLQKAMAVNREHLLPWLPWAEDEPQTLDEKIKLIRRFRGQFDLDGDAVYGIFSDGELVGGIGTHDRIGLGAREIGYWAHIDHARQGIVTRAAAALTRIGFELLGLARMEIHCEPANVASAGVPRKLGYELEATLRKRPLSPLHPDPRDMQIWTMFDGGYATSPMAGIELQAFDIVDRRVL